MKQWLIGLSAIVLTACSSPKAADDDSAARVAALDANYAQAEHDLPAWTAWRTEISGRKRSWCVESGWCINDRDAWPFQPLPAQIEDEPINPVTTLVDLKRQLSAHGIDLLLVVIPARAMIQPESVVPGEPPPGRPDLEVLRLFRTLETRGVEVLDLYDAFHAAREERYVDERGATHIDHLWRKVNHHWSSRGAQVAAEAIATRIQRYPWFAEVSAERGKIICGHRQVLHPKMALTTFDLPPNWSRSEGFEDDNVLHEVFPIGVGNAPNSLDKTSPVTVIGDSFATHDWDLNAGLPQHLMSRLGFRVDARARAAGSAYSVRVATKLERPGLTGVKLVVYEVYVPFLIHPLEDWKPLDMFSAPAEGKADAP